MCRRLNLYQALHNTQQWINSPAKPPAGSLLGREVTTLTFSPPWLNVPSEQKYCTGQSQRPCWLHNNYLQRPRRLVGHVWEQIYSLREGLVRDYVLSPGARRRQSDGRHGKWAGLEPAVRVHAKRWRSVSNSLESRKLERTWRKQLTTRVCQW